MNLTIVRHGETRENRKGIVQGHLDTRLSLLGQEQAKKVGKRLSCKNFDVAYSSDLTRAFDTAREIVVYHNELTLIRDCRVRERYLGVMQGNFRPENPDWIFDPLMGVEIEKMFRSRVESFLLAIVDRHKNNNVLLVSHGGTIRMLLPIIYKKSLTELGFSGKTDNTGVYEFVIGNDMRVLKTITFNCTKHLKL